MFNAATWFVDRNVAEGRGGSPAIRYDGRILTYADLRELVDRTGHVAARASTSAAGTVSSSSASTRPSCWARCGAR